MSRRARDEGEGGRTATEVDGEGIEPGLVVAAVSQRGPGGKVGGTVRPDPSCRHRRQEACSKDTLPATHRSGLPRGQTRRMGDRRRRKAGEWWTSQAVRKRAERRESWERTREELAFSLSRPRTRQPACACARIADRAQATGPVYGQAPAPGKAKERNQGIVRLRASA